MTQFTKEQLQHIIVLNADRLFDTQAQPGWKKEKLVEAIIEKAQMIVETDDGALESYRIVGQTILNYVRSVERDQNPIQIVHLDEGIMSPEEAAYYAGLPYAGSDPLEGEDPQHGCHAVLIRAEIFDKDRNMLAVLDKRVDIGYGPMTSEGEIFGMAFDLLNGALIEPEPEIELKHNPGAIYDIKMPTHTPGLIVFNVDDQIWEAVRDVEGGETEEEFNQRRAEFHRHERERRRVEVKPAATPQQHLARVFGQDV